MTRISLLIAAAAIVGFAGIAQADPGGVPNENAADGQANKVENCQAVISKQNLGGQTGGETGSENDSKQAFTAVTNCDGFWNPS